MKMGKAILCETVICGLYEECRVIGTPIVTDRLALMLLRPQLFGRLIAPTVI